MNAILRPKARAARPAEFRRPQNGASNRARKNLAEVLHELGDVDPARIRWIPWPGSATVRDVIRIKDNENRLFELVDGVLVEKAMGFPQAFLAAFLVRLIGNFVDENNLGIVLGADGMMRLFPKLLRIPDVSYFSWQTIKGKIPTEAAPLIAPDLAVEVLSPSNRKKEIDRKRSEYFKAGTKAMWIADPKSRTVNVYTSVNASKILTVRDTLSGGSVLPRFSLDVKNLFGELNRTQGAR